MAVTMVRSHDHYWVYVHLQRLDGICTAPQAFRKRRSSLPAGRRQWEVQGPCAGRQSDDAAVQARECQTIARFGREDLPLCREALCLHCRELALHGNYLAYLLVLRHLWQMHTQKAAREEGHARCTAC
jgi:hypothetical protein